jgi:hypothetical protein
MKGNGRESEAGKGLVMVKTCSGLKAGGQRCQARPLRDETFCFWHHPDHAEAAEQARKLGGQRRRREGTLQGAYEFDGLASVTEITRLLEIAVMDALGLDNSVARVRALIAAALAAARLLEVGEQEERLAAIEAALGPRVISPTKRR